jgi:hypothetical protein
MQTTAVASLTDHFRRFLEAVQEACGLPGTRRLLAAPMALLLWIRTRRMRKEAAAAMAEAFRALMEQFAVLLEDFRAGKLPASAAPEVSEAEQVAEVKPGDSKERVGEYTSPSRFAGPVGPLRGPTSPERRGESSVRARQLAAARPPRLEIAPPCSSASFAVNNPERRGRAREPSPAACVLRHWIPAVGPPLRKRKKSLAFPRVPGALVQRARPPPRGLIFVGNSVGWAWAKAEDARPFRCYLAINRG